MDTAWDFEDVWMDKIRESIAYLDLFMPSYDEAAKLTGEKDPSRIAALFKKLGAKNVIIKLGTQGALVCPLGQEERLIPAYLCEHPADTTGAGIPSRRDFSQALRRAGINMKARVLPMRWGRIALRR